MKMYRYRRSYWSLLFVACMGLMLWACDDPANELREESVLRSSATSSASQGNTNNIGGSARPSLDRYIEQEVSKPYNIEIHYRYNEAEIDRSWVASPARISNSLQFVNVLKYLFLEPYTELMGIDFVRRFSPQSFILTGTLGYNPAPSKSNTRAFTINGVKIIFMNMNDFDFPTMKDRYDELEALQSSGSSRYTAFKEWLEGENNLYLSRLKTTYLRTIFHESAHTFHQRVEPSKDFDKISSLDYKQADWLSGWANDNKNSLHYGFITNYASQDPHEDFAELFGNYIILTPEEWSERLTQANVVPDGRTLSGKAIIEQKLAFIKKYMQDQWSLNMDTLREYVQKRYPEFARQDFSQMNLPK